MKNRHHIIALMAAMATLLASCEKTIDFTGEVIENKTPVMISLPETDSTWTVRLTNSRFFLSSYPITTIDNATFSIEVNGQHLGNRATNLGNGMYNMGYIPRSGDTITLNVMIPDRGELKAGCRIPSRPTIGEISYDWDTTSYDYSYGDDATTHSYGNVTVKFILTDPANEKNYYMLRVAQRMKNYDYNGEDESWSNWFYSYITVEDNVLFDPNLTNEIIEIGDADNEGNRILFTDERINGKDHQISFDLYYNSIDTYQYRLELYSLSRDSYYFFKTRKAAESQDDFTGIFAEPVQIYTNVDGGIGILGGIASKKYILKEISYQAK